MLKPALALSLAAALASAAHAGPALGELRQLGASAGAPAAEPAAPAAALVALKAAAPKKAKVKMETKKLRALLDELLKAVPDEQRLAPIGPIADDFGGQWHWLGVSFLLNAKKDAIAVLFYDLDASEAQFFAARRPDESRIVAFSINGLRYQYLLRNDPARAPQYLDETKDGLEREELADVGSAPFNVRNALEQVFDQIRSGK